MTITREQLDRYRHPGLHFLDKGGLDVTVARGMFEHLLVIAEAHLSEQSRIDAAVAKERERCAEIARARANTFTADTSGDYRDGEYFAAREIEKAIRIPTPTTEECA